MSRAGSQSQHQRSQRSSSFCLISRDYKVPSSSVLCHFSLLMVCQHWSYSFAGLIGFSVSWQFGSCYSWTAKKVDITGRLSPLFFIGCGLGSAAMPPLTGYIFTSDLGPNSILYLNVILVVVISSLWASMWLLSRKRIHSDEVELKYRATEG